MESNPKPETQTTTIKLLEQEYRIKTDRDPEHLQRVAEYVEGVLREVRVSTPDTQTAAILTALNIASDLVELRELTSPPLHRIQALIDLIDSA